MPSKLIRLLVAIAVLAPFAVAQRTCHAHDHHVQLMQSDPAYAAAQTEIEGHTQEVVSSGATLENVITIPVVVHVVWNTSSENLPLSTIQNQIQVLNEDFRRTNPDVGNTPGIFQGVAADCEIEFCLASRDPQGLPTDGVVRRQTGVTSFGTNDNIKFTSSGGSDAWPSSDYLNVWVGDLSGGLLGYAQFPGGPSSTDGVVCDINAFGRNTPNANAPFDLGRTMTHEVGHWLNLRHIWGDGGCSVDDFVADTPTSDAPNYGCATGVVNCGSTDMPENYMDYSDDGCMNIFTLGQKARMRALFNPGGARASLLNSLGCGPVVPPTPEYQLNSSDSVLRINGVNGTQQSFATTAISVGDNASFFYGSTLAGAAWDVFVGVLPPVPATGGGLVTPGGNIINMNLLDPTLTTRSAINGTAPFAPWTGNIVENIPIPVPLGLSFQQVIVTASALDGFVLSQPAYLLAQSCSVPALPSGPAGDDSSVFVDFGGQAGCTYDFVFYGTSYTSFDVISNGRVTFQGPDVDFSPSLNQARNNNPFAGFWTDLDPSAGGSVSLSNPGGDLIRISYQNVPYYAQSATVSFDMDFDLTTNSITLSGLQGINPNPVGSSAGDRQFLGISPGNGAQNTSAFTMSPGGSGSVGGNQMLYDYKGTGGNLVSTITAGTSTILIVPAGSGYSWSAL